MLKQELRQNSRPYFYFLSVGSFSEAVLVRNVGVTEKHTAALRQKVSKDQLLRELQPDAAASHYKSGRQQCCCSNRSQ